MAQNFGPSTPVTPATPPEQPKRNNTMLIIVIVLVILLCCCLAIGGLGWWLWTNGDQLLEQLGAIRYALLV